MAGRRGKGEGSIYRRKDGRWVGQYEVNDERRYVYGRIRKEVAERLSKAMAERDAGLAFDSKNLSLAEYLRQYSVEETLGYGSSIVGYWDQRLPDHVAQGS